MNALLPFLNFTCIYFYFVCGAVVIPVLETKYHDVVRIKKKKKFFFFGLLTPHFPFLRNWVT